MPFQDVTSAGLLDVTDNSTVAWLKDQMQDLLNQLGRQDSFFYVDCGNTFHTPTYFEVRRMVSS